MLTHFEPSDIGHNSFCEGNVEKAVEEFEREHICNHFCKWPGFNLWRLKGNIKGKGKATDPFVVSSD